MVAEGLLMYLDRQMYADWSSVCASFPGCRLIADVFSADSPFGTRHASLKATGATIGWGIDDPRELEAWAPGIRLLEEWIFSSDPSLPA